MRVDNSQSAWLLAQAVHVLLITCMSLPISLSSPTKVTDRTGRLQGTKLVTSNLRLVTPLQWVCSIHISRVRLVLADV